MHKCIETARRNLLLGRWVRDLSPRWRLLHHEAHAVFNGAVIILLHQLAFLNTAEPNDISAVHFAIEVFDQEAALGNNFGVDCSKVLQDLDSLVQGLKECTAPPMPPILPSVESQMNLEAPVELDQPPVGSSLAGMHMTVGDNSALQRELQTWLDYDYMQLYSNEYMI